MHRSILLVVFTARIFAAAPAFAEAPDTSWAESAAALVPAGYVAGSPRKTDLATMTGLLAVFRAGADDPKTPRSAFDWGLTLVVEHRRDGRRAESRRRRITRAHT